MTFSLAYLKSDSQFLYREFLSSKQSQILDISELKEKPIQALLFNKDAANDDLMNLLAGENRFYPVRPASDYQIDSTRFENLSDEEAKKIFRSMQDFWLMGNNISLIDELFKTLEVLQKLWPNDRTAFFEQLWFIVKSNLAAKSLKLIYNDIILAKAENEKNKLIQACVDGKRMPNPTQGGELEAKIMGHYEKSFNQHFQISEYDKDNGRLVLLARIKGSPVIMMAEVTQFTQLQKAILNSLFEGLQK